MGKALGIPLGIDYAKIDRDLNMVADKIEGLGKDIKIGISASGGGGGGGIGADLSGFGDRLATGVASGIRSSSSLMLVFAANMQSMFDKFSGAAITTFQRINASITFPMFDAFFRGATAKLVNFSAFWRKPLSDIDLAVSGAFGAMIGKLTRVFKELASQIAVDFSKAFSGVSDGFARAEASAAGLFGIVQKTVTTASHFNMGTAGLATSIPGPKIGTGTQFLKPPDPGPVRMYGYELKAVEGTTQDVLRMFDVMARGLAAPFTLGTAAILGTIGAFRRMGNVLSSIGPVTKKTFGDMFNSMVKIGTLGFMPNAVESAKNFNRTITSSNSLVGKLTGSVMGLGTALLAAFGVVGVIYKTVQFLIGGVKAASDLNTAVMQTKTVFGSSFGIVESQAEAMNKQFRISKQEQLDLAANFGNIAQNAGMSEQASAGFANRMVRMAADLKAQGLADSLQEAGDAITSGLTGRGMELKKLGAVMDEDAVKAYSLAKGVRKAGEEMGREDTLMTRAELVMRGLSVAQGALERNAGTSAQAFAKAGGGVQEFAVQAGQLLLPAITTLTDAFNTLMSSTLTFFETNKTAIAGWATWLKDKIAFVGVVVRNLDIVWEMAQLKVGEFVINTVAQINAIAQNWEPIWNWIKENWLGLLEDMMVNFLEFGKNLGTIGLRLGKAIWEALSTGEFKFDFDPKELTKNFQNTVSKLPDMIKPEIISVDARMKELAEKMAKREAEIAGGIAGAAPGKPGALPELDKDKKGADYKLSSAMEISSKEAASVIARSQTAGVGKGDTPKEHLKVSKDSNEELKKINNNLAMAPRIVVKNGRA